MSDATRTSPASRRVEAHGMGVHIHDWGGSGQAVVMLHGLGFTGRMFDPIARVLSPEFRVLCPDMRGHGRSDHAPEGYQYPNLVKDLEGVVQLMRLSRVVLVGHTWGADVALAFAHKHPRLTRGLVLVDGGYRFRGASNDSPDEEAEKQRPQTRFATIDAALDDARSQLGTWSPDIELAVRDSLEQSRDGFVTYRVTERRWQQIYKALWAYDPGTYLGTVRTRTLLVHPEGSGTAQERALAAFQARGASLLLADSQLLKLHHQDNLSLLADRSFAHTVQDFLQNLPA